MRGFLRFGKDHWQKLAYILIFLGGWQAFVTIFGIKEAIFLSDRVIVLSARSSRIVAALDVDLPRPRTLEVRTSPKFGGYALEIYKSLEIT